MMIALGLLMLAAGFWVATRLTGASRLVHRAGSGMAVGTGALLIMAGTVRPELTTLAIVALCVCLLWLAASPPPVPRAAKKRDEVTR